MASLAGNIRLFAYRAFEIWSSYWHPCRVAWLTKFHKAIKLLIQRKVSRVALEIESKRIGPVAIVVLKGKVTLGPASQALRKAVEDLVDGGCPRVVLNLAGVPFIDSAGLGALTVGFTKAKNAGGLLKLAEAQARVEDALEMTRLTRIFPLYASEQSAVQSFEQPV